MIPTLKKLSLVKKLIASLISDDDGSFKHFHFFAGGDEDDDDDDEPDEIAKPRITLKYADRELFVLEATNQNLEALANTMKRLDVQEDDIADAAARVMDAPGAATKADLEMVAFLAIQQVRTATNRYDAETVDILNGDNLFVVLVQDGEFFHFEFEGNKNKKRLN
jgi:hypothetical protein